MLENHDTSTFKAYYNKKAIEERIELLKKIEKQLKSESERKTIFNKNKYEKYTQNNLGEQETDS
jgi:ribosomal protein L18E